jgi:hypothetical protein
MAKKKRTKAEAREARFWDKAARRAWVRLEKTAAGKELHRLAEEVVREMAGRPAAEVAAAFRARLTPEQRRLYEDEVARAAGHETVEKMERLGLVTLTYGQDGEIARVRATDKGKEHIRRRRRRGR